MMKQVLYNVHVIQFCRDAVAERTIKCQHHASAEACSNTALEVNEDKPLLNLNLYDIIFQQV